jgi:hypothetical protein
MFDLLGSLFWLCPTFQDLGAPFYQDHHLDATYFLAVAHPKAQNILI